MARKSEIDGVASSLRKLGLNAYQSKALSGLIVLDDSTAPQLAEFTGIPQARIYSVMNSLIDIDTVRKKPGRPVRYQVVNPKDITDNIIHWNRRRLEKEVESYEREAEGVESSILKLGKVRSGDVPRDFIEVVHAGDTSLAETRKAIGKTEKEILVISNVMEYLPDIHEELEAALKRGVEVKVLLNNPTNVDKRGRKIQEETLKILKNMNTQIKHVNETPLRMTIVDTTFSIFSVREDKDFHYNKDMVISKHKNMIKALKKYFKCEWEESETI